MKLCLTVDFVSIVGKGEMGFGVKQMGETFNSLCVNLILNEVLLLQRLPLLGISHYRNHFSRQYVREQKTKTKPF